MLPGRQDEALRALGTYLANGAWSVALFDNLLEQAAVGGLPAFLNAGVRCGWRMSSRCPGIRLQGTYEDYLKAQFERKKRYNLERQVRVALSDKGLRHRRVDKQEDLPHALNDLFALHARRKQAANVQSSFIDGDVQRFHHAVAPALLRAGWLSLQLLSDGERPVSAAYGFRYNGRFYFYQSGMDPDWSRWSVGTVLLTMLIKESFEGGLQEFDFLKGDEAYKVPWANAARQQVELAIHRRDMAGTLGYAARVLKQGIKSFVSRSSVGDHVQ